MEKTSSHTYSPSFSLADVLEFIFFHVIFNWVIKIQKYYRYFLVGRSKRKLAKSESFNHKVRVSEKQDDGKLEREDVEMVMEKLRIVCDPKCEKLQERLGLNEVSCMFDEEPSVEEVKEAFDVFDVNKDGFVDATELQRVLSSLGCREGSEMERCEKMIRTFDENEDGMIDFDEFVKLMERSFC
ncbi:hypothetical protein GIB67_011919 [Kingdonia uniflora]|uniref:EF-hand domain-containing protein n=1 Tax=Kingdonia uniflora TaxID=39325 RepID=A0A7J7M016_9MAGN|nr:hypothetical protein GIB67_011919 [Kingdonia uniflora]